MENKITNQDWFLTALGLVFLITSLFTHNMFALGWSSGIFLTLNIKWYFPQKENAENFLKQNEKMEIKECKLNKESNCACYLKSCKKVDDCAVKLLMKKGFTVEDCFILKSFSAK